MNKCGVPASPIRGAMAGAGSTASQAAYRESIERHQNATQAPAPVGDLVGLLENMAGARAALLREVERLTQIADAFDDRPHPPPRWSVRGNVG